MFTLVFLHSAPQLINNTKLVFIQVLLTRDAPPTHLRSLHCRLGGGRVHHAVPQGGQPDLQTLHQAGRELGSLQSGQSWIHPRENTTVGFTKQVCIGTAAAAAAAIQVT